jgi:hypothetical protein
MDVFLVENRVAGAGFIRAGGAVRGSPRSDAAGRPWRSAGSLPGAAGAARSAGCWPTGVAAAFRRALVEWRFERWE